MQFEISIDLKIISQIFMWECDCSLNCNFILWEQQLGESLSSLIYSAGTEKQCRK